MEFREGMNILAVTTTPKSTVLEAVSLALTGRFAVRGFFSALSLHLFNQATADADVQAIAALLRMRSPTSIG